MSLDPGRLMNEEFVHFNRLKNEKILIINDVIIFSIFVSNPTVK